MMMNTPDNQIVFQFPDGFLMFANEKAIQEKCKDLYSVVPRSKTLFLSNDVHVSTISEALRVSLFDEELKEVSWTKKN